MIKVFLSFVLMFAFVSCNKTQIRESRPDESFTIDENYKIPKNHNFEFVGYNTNIENPSNDRRCYYKIFIDKVEMGRTTTGLESQEKRYETRLTENRHLVTIEKWILDKEKGEYVKVNNIQQPKPSYFYFKIYKSRIVKVELLSEIYGKAEYKVEYLKE